MSDLKVITDSKEIPPLLSIDRVGSNIESVTINVASLYARIKQLEQQLSEANEIFEAFGEIKCLHLGDGGTGSGSEVLVGIDFDSILEISNMITKYGVSDETE